MAKVHIPFRIRRSIDGQWYFVIVAENGKVTSTSETYKTKRSCVKGINASVYVVYRSLESSPASYKEELLRTRTAQWMIKDETIKAVQVNG